MLKQSDFLNVHSLLTRNSADASKKSKWWRIDLNLKATAFRKLGVPDNNTLLREDINFGSSAKMHEG